MQQLDPLICLSDDEQFQLITWAKDHFLRLWAIEPRMIMVSIKNSFTG